MSSFLYEVALEAFEDIIKGAVRAAMRSLTSTQKASNEAKNRKKKD